MATEDYDHILKEVIGAQRVVQSPAAVAVLPASAKLLLKSLPEPSRPLFALIANAVQPDSATTATRPGMRRRQMDSANQIDALKAEVIIPSDPDTTLNQGLIDRLSRCERILVCGQAKSHCVNFTVRDLVNNIGWAKERLSNIWVLEDAMSAVPGFETDAEQFITDMNAAGLTITTVDKVFPA